MKFETSAISRYIGTSIKSKYTIWYLKDTYVDNSIFESLIYMCQSLEVVKTIQFSRLSFSIRINL